MTLLHAGLLGTLQGLTEFLPVSSSAHLILARAFFGWDWERFGVPFDVACHAGTLLALLVYFRGEVARMVAALPHFNQPADPSARLLRLIIIGTLPIVAAGLLFENVIEEELRTPGVAASMLALGAIALLVGERVGSQDRSEWSLTASDAVALGLAQAAALVPGVSRSGATLALALVLGLRREAAARFVFLLGVPAILGVAVYEALALRQQGVTADMAQLLAAGTAASALVGYVTVKYFIQYLGRHSLAGFAWYRLALAAGVAVWLVARQ